jgi:23S rRNA (guanosine2251-2'-O)-methyltransferase
MSSRIVIGKHGVLTCVSSSDHVEKVYLRKGAAQNHGVQRIIEQSKERRILVQWLEPSTFDYRFKGDHQGVACIAHALTQFSIADAIQEQPSVILMLDHIQDPHNFGAICRSAEAFGVRHVCYPKNRSVQITPSVEKASAGAIEMMQFCKLTNLNQSLKQLSKAGYWVYAASSNAGNPVQNITFHRPMVLIMGSEHQGVSPGLNKAIDEWVHIPLAGKTSSLNVSVAAGILLNKIALD